MVITTNEIYLSIGLEHKDGKIAYAGNYDEIMSVFIAGTSMNERYGYAMGLAAYEKYVQPYVDMIDVFECFQTDFGDSWYSLDPNDPNRLYMKIESYITFDAITDLLNDLWPRIEGIYLGEHSLDDHTVCIKDIRIITIELVTQENEFIFVPKNTDRKK